MPKPLAPSQACSHHGQCGTPGRLKLQVAMPPAQMSEQPHLNARSHNL